MEDKLDIRIGIPYQVSCGEEFVQVESSLFVAKQDREIWNKHRSKDIKAHLTWMDESGAHVLQIPAYNRDNKLIVCTLDRNNVPGLQPKTTFEIKFVLEFLGDVYETPKSVIHTDSPRYKQNMKNVTLGYYTGPDEILDDSDMRETKKTRGVMQVLTMPYIHKQ